MQLIQQNIKIILIQFLFLKQKINRLLTQNFEPMGKATCDDIYMSNAVTQKLKMMASFDLILNLLGFGLLFLQRFFFEQDQQYLQTMCFIFFLLTVLQVCTYGFAKREMYRLWEISHPHKPKYKYKLIAFCVESFNTLQMLIQICHFILIFVQPNFMYPLHINNHLTALSYLRVYTLAAYHFNINITMNPRLERVTTTFGVDVRDFRWKMKFKRQYFYYLVVSIGVVIMVGFGNAIKFYDQGEFEDIFEATYFLFETMSTVGYGDFVVKSFVARSFCVVSIILGNFVACLVTYKILKSTKMNLLQKGIYHLNNKLTLNRTKDELFANMLSRLLDNQIGDSDIQDGQLYCNNKGNRFLFQNDLGCIIKQQAYLSSINPVQIVNLIDKTKNWIPKLKGMNLINQYIQTPFKMYQGTKQMSIIQQ